MINQLTVYDTLKLLTNSISLSWKSWVATVSDSTISVGIAGGCEYIVASEMEFNREELIRQIERSIIRGNAMPLLRLLN